MDSYIGWIVAVLTIGILYIFSGGGSSGHKKRRKAEKKREKQYAGIAAQFQQTDNDEYQQIRRKIENELIRATDKDKRALLSQSLYGLKARDGQRETGILIASGIALPVTIFCVSSSNIFLSEYANWFLLFRVIILLGYSAAIFAAIRRKSKFGKLICIIEGMLSEIDGCDREKQDTEAEDLENLIGRLKESQGEKQEI